MIGFFEHQYLSFKKNHLRNLIALAKADGHLHAEEEKMLYKMGEKYGLKDRQIASLIRSKAEKEVQIPETHEQKMNQLYDLVMMVYADSVVEKSEVKFCEDLMEDFGFKKDIVKWMISKFDEASPPATNDWDELVKEAEKFEK